MSWILIFITLIISNILYNYIIYELRYKIDLEAIRINRVNKFRLRVICLRKRIEKLETKKFKTKDLANKAKEKVKELEEKIKKINLDIEELEKTKK